MTHTDTSKVPAAPPAAEITEVPVAHIDVPEGRVPVGDADALVESIGEVGRMLQPVLVRPAGRRGRYELVAGLARLEAARLLEWRTVPATVAHLSDDAAELAGLDENLVRAELSAAARARLTWRRQLAYERLHPAARRGIAGANGRHLSADGAARSASETVSLAEGKPRDDPPASPLPRGFARDTADRVGRTPRSVQQDAQVGRELGEGLLARLEATPVGGSKRDLLTLARMDGARRERVVREVERSGHAKVSHAEAAVAKAERQRDLRRRAKAAEHQGEQGGPRPWAVVAGDCLDVLAAAAAGEGGNSVTTGPHLAPGSVRMAFADPPYDRGKDYGRGPADDRKGGAAYAEFTRRWVALCAPLLTPDGSLWVCVDHRCLRHVLNAVHEAGLHQRSVVSWPEGFAQYQPRNFTPGRFLVYAVKDPKKFVFHADAVTVPSARQAKYNDPRANPAGRTMSGHWPDVPTLCGTFAERGGGVTQLPVALVERPLLACTDPGDLVLDPFGGEGTTGVAVARHGRRCVLVERDRRRARRAEARLLAGGSEV